MIKGFSYYIKGTEDIKQTPNQIAKNIVLDAVFNSLDFWSESSVWNRDTMTALEVQKVSAAVQKQVTRVTRVVKLMGLS